MKKAQTSGGPSGGSKDYLIKNRTNPSVNKWVKAALEKRPATELYINDKDQMHNVAAAPANAKIIKALKEKLDNWRRHTHDPLLTTDEEIFDTYPYHGGEKLKNKE